MAVCDHIENQLLCGFPYTYGGQINYQVLMLHTLCPSHMRGTKSVLFIFTFFNVHQDSNVKIHNTEVQVDTCGCISTNYHQMQYILQL